MHLRFIHKYSISSYESYFILFLQDEAKKKQERLQAELSVIKVRLRELETANENLTRKTGEIKQQLREHVDINDDKYYELRGMADELLTVKDLLAVSL